MGCSGSKDGDRAKPDVTNGPPSDATPANEPTALTPPAEEQPRISASENGEVAKPKELTAAQLAEVRDLFNSFDVDDLGKLPLEHFANVSMKLGPHDSDFLTTLKNMDVNYDGFITKEVGRGRDSLRVHSDSRIHVTPLPPSYPDPFIPTPLYPFRRPSLNPT